MGEHHAIVRDSLLSQSSATVVRSRSHSEDAKCDAPYGKCEWLEVDRSPYVHPPPSAVNTDTCRKLSSSVNSPKKRARLAMQRLFSSILELWLTMLCQQRMTSHPCARPVVNAIDVRSSTRVYCDQPSASCLCSTMETASPSRYAVLRL